MQHKAHSKHAARYVRHMHDTLEDVSWDLGSLEHRIGQLEIIVKQIKSDLSTLRERFSYVERNNRPSKPAASISFEKNSHDGGSEFPSVGTADS